MPQGAPRAVPTSEAGIATDNICARYLLVLREWRLSKSGPPRRSTISPGGPDLQREPFRRSPAQAAADDASQWQQQQCGNSPRAAARRGRAGGSIPNGPGSRPQRGVNHRAASRYQSCAAVGPALTRQMLAEANRRGNKMPPSRRDGVAVGLRERGHGPCPRAATCNESFEETRCGLTMMMLRSAGANKSGYVPRATTHLRQQADRTGLPSRDRGELITKPVWRAAERTPDR